MSLQTLNKRTSSTTYNSSGQFSTLMKFSYKHKLATAVDPDELDLSRLNLKESSETAPAENLEQNKDSSYPTKERSKRNDELKSARFMFERCRSLSPESLLNRSSRSLRQSNEHDNRDRSRSPNSRKR